MLEGNFNQSIGSSSTEDEVKNEPMEDISLLQAIPENTTEISTDTINPYICHKKIDGLIVNSLI